MLTSLIYFLGFRIYNSDGSHYPVIKECFCVQSDLNLKQQPIVFSLFEKLVVISSVSFWYSVFAESSVF